MEAYGKVVKFVNDDRWRSAFIVLAIIFLIHYLMMEGMLESFSQGSDPTVDITLYYKDDCPSCPPVFYHWAKLVSNLRADGRILPRAVDCGDPINAAECARQNPNGLVPTLVKRQISGRSHVFSGNHHHANYYDFANRDY